MADAHSRTRQVTGAIARGDYDDHAGAAAAIAAAFASRRLALFNHEVIDDGDTVIVHGMGDLDNLVGAVKRTDGDESYVTIEVNEAIDIDGIITNSFGVPWANVRRLRVATKDAA